MSRVWNNIDFDDWTQRALSITTNYCSRDAVWIELEGDGYETYDRVHSMTPDEARDVARKLIEAADAVERAGEAQ